MVAKITANTSVLVCWMEPARDRGRESFVRAKCVVKPHRSKLRVGMTAMVKWRSSGRIYRAVIKAIDGQPEAQSQVQSQQMSDTDDDEPISAMITPRGDAEITQTPRVNDGDSAVSGTSTLNTEQVCFIDGQAPEVEHTTPQPPAAVNPSVPLDNAKEINELKSGLQNVRKEVEDLRLEVKNLGSCINDVIQEKLNLLITAVSEVKQQGDGLQNLVTQRINRKKASECNTPNRPRPSANSESPVTPTSSGAACKRISPFYGILNGNLVKMPIDDTNSVFLEKDKYEQYFLKSSTATCFVRRLMPHFFTSEEMLQSNFDGGEVVTGVGKVLKVRLDRPKVKAILRQAELEYKGCTQTPEGYAKLRIAINDRCRAEGRK